MKTKIIEQQAKQPGNIFLAGNLVVSNSNPDSIILCTNKVASDEFGERFCGVILVDNSNNTIHGNYVGEYSNNWLKSMFKLFKGEIHCTQ